jgi:hypothetical protein
LLPASETEKLEVEEEAKPAEEEEKELDADAVFAKLSSLKQPDEGTSED